MRKSKLLKNRAVYTADTESIDIDAQNIKQIQFGFDFLQNGAAAPTLATLITHTATVKLTVGGEVETLVRVDDLYVLNKLLDRLNLGDENIPFYLLPAADNQYGRVDKIILPVLVSTDKSVKLDLDYAGLATIDGETLTIGVEFGDKPFPAKPVAIRYVGDTTNTTGKEIDMALAGKSLVGLLIFNTTIGAAGAAHDFTVGELKFLINREEKAHYQVSVMETIPSDVEDVITRAIFDNYRFIDLTEDPYPADKLKVWVKSLSAAVDAFRLIGIYR